jgi:ATP-dependent DNA helicase RecQ
MLVKQGIDAKLIQSDDNLNLYNLLEFRYFIKSIEKCNSPIVDKNTWVEAKEKLKRNYSQSFVLKDVLKVIESFEKEPG